MVRLGIIGTGKIVPEALKAMTPVDGLQKQAIFARPHSSAKAEQIARDYAIPEVYTSPQQEHRMTEEFRDFVRMIESEDLAETGRLLDESVSVVRVLDKIHAALIREL